MDGSKDGVVAEAGEFRNITRSEEAVCVALLLSHNLMTDTPSALVASCCGHLTEGRKEQPFKSVRW
jgi:hypothetical protein